MKERTHLQNAVNRVLKLQNDTKDHLALIELGEAEGDAAVVKDAENAIFEMQKNAAQWELESLLSGEADGNDAYLEVNAGAGGTESQDWAEMIFRMYSRWAEQHGYKIALLDESRGEVAGIKSATLEISGENAYGWLKTESGVHRLVRISPYDANARRHTSFASVSVMPVVDDDIKIEILDKDLKIETMRAGGAGGQHVNKTESAIRITHVPTNIVVACQQERSQVQNRAKAMEMLKARLYERELRKKEEASAEINATKTDIGFGHQIRSYVLHPYQLVKDVRTEVETSDAAGVLDGDLDPFLQASLASRLQGRKEETEEKRK
jgi:peptide chain release factor 2